MITLFYLFLALAWVLYLTAWRCMFHVTYWVVEQPTMQQVGEGLISSSLVTLFPYLSTARPTVRRTKENSGALQIMGKQAKNALGSQQVAETSGFNPTADQWYKIWKGAEMVMLKVETVDIFF